MGYVVLHIEKAAGTDAAMSGHVERRIAPANVITTLTYLNEELVEFPKGVTNRIEAIQHRLDNAGLERKIGKNQVRALRVVMSGSPEDMKRIRQAGQLNAWAKDSCGWLQKPSERKMSYRQSCIWTRKHHISTRPSCPLSGESGEKLNWSGRETRRAESEHTVPRKTARVYVPTM